MKRGHDGVAMPQFICLRTNVPDVVMLEILAEFRCQHDCAVASTRN